MRRLSAALIAAVFTFSFIQFVSAADLPAKAPVSTAPVVAPLYDWTGLYAGGYVGVGVQRSHAYDPQVGVPVGGEIEHTGSGFTGGGTLGYNWQLIPNWIVGVEGDIGYLGLDHSFSDYLDLRVNSKTSWIATLRGRVGYSFGPTLSYVTGGAAFVGVEDVADTTAFGGNITTSSKTKSGYAIGTGVETMLGGNWTAKAEYLYVDVGSGDTLFPGVESVQVDKHRYSLMKFGLNYLMGGRPQPPLQPHNWTGLYVGLIGGGGATSSRGTDPRGALSGEIANNGNGLGGGLTIGGQAGYNWQFAPNWIAGVEGDFSWFGIDHTVSDYYDVPASLNVKTNWLATLRGRVGYSTGPALIYVTAGGAWVNLRDSFQASSGGAPLVSDTKTLSGFTVGGGIETVLAGNWTTRTEYLFVDAGDGNTLNSAGALLRVSHQFHLFRAGLSYKFN